jgi:hypothetical protein
VRGGRFAEEEEGSEEENGNEDYTNEDLSTPRF